MSMQFTPEGPNALPLWCHGRALLTMPPHWFTVTHPQTGAPLRLIPLCDHHNAQPILRDSRAALANWQAVPVSTRQQALLRLVARLEQFRANFIALLQEDGLDAATATKDFDLAVSARWQDQDSPKISGKVLACLPGQKMPFSHALNFLAQHLPQGNTVILKPAPGAASALFALCELASRADDDSGLAVIPDGVLNLLHGDQAALTALCAGSADGQTDGVDGIAAYGNSALLTQVQALAATHAVVLIDSAAN